jgi:pyridoxamine 5'-phosphate oxidase
MASLANLRKEYQQQAFNKEDAAENAVEQFERWWQEAVTSGIDEVNAMTLATASADGLPTARIVLLKGYSEKGFQFYTNYDSYKGKQLQENPRACLVFFWKELDRQIRITGLVEKLTEKESNDYFRVRPHGSRIGAWASPQSTVIESSEWLMNQAKGYEEKFSDSEIPRPDYWGGYLVKPVTLEFWQGRPDRLHDRLQYSLQENGSWIIERLAP